MWAYGRRQQPFTLEQAIEGLGYGPKHRTHAEKCVEWCVNKGMLIRQGSPPGKYVLTELARFVAANITAALADECSSAKDAKK